MALNSRCVPGLSLAQSVASPGEVISLGGAGVVGKWGRGSCLHGHRGGGSAVDVWVRALGRVRTHSCGTEPGLPWWAWVSQRAHGAASG